MVSFSNRKSPDQERRDAISARDRYYYEIKTLEKEVVKLKKEIDLLKNANQEVAYWKDVAETLQEYIDLMEE
tara:strand:+ start:716 stop:931 length:216 start_codon:yes stop_codon:yes gene_type:complete